MPSQDVSGPLRWFLNHAAYTLSTAKALQVNSTLLEKLRRLLMLHNPLLNQFKRLAEEPSQEARLELTVSDINEIVQQLLSLIAMVKSTNEHWSAGKMDRICPHSSMSYPHYLYRLITS